MADVDVLADDAVEPDRPSLLRPSMFAAGWWLSVVGGLALVAYAATQAVAGVSAAEPAFWMIAGLLILFELSPVIVGSGYDSQGVATSDAFAFAILYLYGPWPAITLIALSTLVSELVKRKALWKIPFNIGQFTLSIGSAALVMTLGLAARGESLPTLADPLTQPHRRST